MSHFIHVSCTVDVSPHVNNACTPGAPLWKKSFALTFFLDLKKESVHHDRLANLSLDLKKESVHHDTLPNFFWILKDKISAS